MQYSDVYHAIFKGNVLSSINASNPCWEEILRSCAVQHEGEAQTQEFLGRWESRLPIGSRSSVQERKFELTVDQIAEIAQRRKSYGWKW